jgi:penicillin-binding protein-related factor A (putative recombinase)
MADTVNRGKKFEKKILEAFKRENVYILRLPDTMFEAVRNPCDYIVYAHRRLILLECKSCHGTSYAFRHTNVDSSSGYQWQAMLDAIQHDGVVSGYMIWFDDKDVTVFLPMDKLEDYVVKNNRKSINYQDAQEIGFVIGGTKKQIFYDYDMKEFIKYVGQY